MFLLGFISWFLVVTRSHTYVEVRVVVCCKDMFEHRIENLSVYSRLMFWLVSYSVLFPLIFISVYICVGDSLYLAISQSQNDGLQGLKSVKNTSVHPFIFRLTLLLPKDF